VTAGGLRDRCAFHRLDTTSDAYGNPTSGYSGTAFLTVWGRLRVERGRERVEGGRLQSEVAATLTIRSSADARGVTEVDQVRIDGETFQIRAITNPDRRGRFLEMTLERGTAQG
jgi:SPP1 family predicted phage head-tail adaptor